MKAVLLASFFMLLLLQVDPGGAESYEYRDEEKVEANDVDDGDRLVGGEAIHHRDYPFMVGWNWWHRNDNGMACSGFLITPTYFVSAAHCNGLLFPKESKDRIEEYRKACVEATKKYGKYTIRYHGYPWNGDTYTLKCRWLKYYAFEIVAEPPGKVFLGVTNIRKKWSNPDQEVVDIKRHIRHADTYRGGAGYGKFGGYDITLLEIKRPLIGFKPACIPIPKFDDLRENQTRDDTILAGYGRYRRNKGETCETNRFGPMKFHYCDKVHGEGRDACNKGPPPQQHKECNRFFHRDDTPDTVPSNQEEIRIKRKGRNDVLCYSEYNPMNYEHGWCHTKGNYYLLDHPENKTKSWGFCSDECFLEESTDKIADLGILRKKDKIHVLPEKLCEKYVEHSFYGEVPEVRPSIMCVAHQNKWKEEVYEKKGKGYRKVKQDSETVRYNDTFYVASAGTCKGDSGGPAFVEEKPNHFVVTGIVSGGRGHLGECGGINTVIHYVRLKKFTVWILKNINRHKDRNMVCFNKAMDEQVHKRKIA